ncbi:glycosyltransferase [Nanoarchaeota archaeon]
MRISIIIPAHNEEKRIKRTLLEYGRYFRVLKNKRLLDFEIIVVLNACTDNTLKEVQGVKKKFKEIKILNFKPGGKGFAIIKGFNDALKRKNDLIGFVDADMATKPKDFHDLIKGIKNSDGAIASRYVKGSKICPQQSLSRIIASRMFNFLIKIILFLNYKDTQCGAKIFKRAVIKSSMPKLNITKWAFDVNLLYVCKRNKFDIKELPTIWSDKEYSKLNLKDCGIQMFFSLVRLRLIYSPFKGIIRVYDNLTRFLGKSH